MKNMPVQQQGDTHFFVGKLSNRSLDLVDQHPDHITCAKHSSGWSSFFSSTFSVLEPYSATCLFKRKDFKGTTYGWKSVLRRAMTSFTIRKIQERILGPSRTEFSASTSDKWLLGICYRNTSEQTSIDCDQHPGCDAFFQDFSSRIWITYRKGFSPLEDSAFTSDVNWGCMLRSSQMLFAQALLIHHLGRSWRKSLQKPFDQEYIEILHLFGDSEACSLSIHNLIQAGRIYGLAAGSWVGPYAICRSWEALAQARREKPILGQDNWTLPMALYVVSGEAGKHGGAPVVCMEDAAKLCSDLYGGKTTWAPLLLLVPLVLGLGAVNPRYIPLLFATFTFPQSLGILGGKPGASTYIIGVQDDTAFYLDPHEVQQAVDICRDDLEADTSTYHCNTIRHMSLGSVDPSLAIGFYCRDKDDFDDFCDRASELAEHSDGAPLFTVAQSHKHSRSSVTSQSCDVFDVGGQWSITSGNSQEDEWQLL